jgi:hypothetical protein
MRQPVSSRCSYRSINTTSVAAPYHVPNPSPRELTGLRMLCNMLTMLPTPLYNPFARRNICKHDPMSLVWLLTGCSWLQPKPCNSNGDSKATPCQILLLRLGGVRIVLQSESASESCMSLVCPTDLSTAPSAAPSLQLLTSGNVRAAAPQSHTVAWWLTMFSTQQLERVSATLCWHMSGTCPPSRLPCRCSLCCWCALCATDRHTVQCANTHAGINLATQQHVTEHS